MTNRPKRRWLLRSLLGVILALLAWISFPWIHDSRLLWSIRRPLATRSLRNPPAIICYDPYGRWVFLRHKPHGKFEVASTVLEQDTGKSVQENVVFNWKDQYVPWTATEINESGELIYMVSKHNASDSPPDETGQPSGWFIINAWNLYNGRHSEKMRLPMAGNIAHSRDGSTLIFYTFKESTLEVEKWNPHSAQCIKLFTVSNVNPRAHTIVSQDCHWLVLGKTDAHGGLRHDYSASASYIANVEKYNRAWPERDLFEPQGLRVIDLDAGIEVKEINGFSRPAGYIIVQDNLIELTFYKSSEELTNEHCEIDLANQNRALRPGKDGFAHHGLITPHCCNQWIEQVGGFYGELRRVDLAEGKRRECPHLDFPSTEQASPLGESLMIVNHEKPATAPEWLGPWLTKYDLMNYWPWKECKRIVICEAETGKTVWERRFPLDGYLQADISRDQSKLFVLYWKNDQLELYAFSLDFSWRSYWQQACATLTVFGFVLFFRWPKRKKANPVPAQPSA